MIVWIFNTLRNCILNMHASFLEMWFRFHFLFLVSNVTLLDKPTSLRRVLMPYTRQEYKTIIISLFCFCGYMLSDSAASRPSIRFRNYCHRGEWGSVLGCNTAGFSDECPPVSRGRGKRDTQKERATRGTERSRAYRQQCVWCHGEMRSRRLEYCCQLRCHQSESLVFNEVVHSWENGWYNWLVDSLSGCRPCAYRWQETMILTTTLGFSSTNRTRKWRLIFFGLSWKSSLGLRSAGAGA